MRWPHGIALEVFIQDPTSKAFRLDSTPLGSAPLQEERGTEMILDSSRLDEGTLGVAEPDPQWWDITARCSAITSMTGTRPDLVIPTAETGTLEATMIDDPGLLAMGITPGTPIRLRHGSTPMWIGWIDDVAVTWDKTGGSISTISATDWVSHARRITRYGRQIDLEAAIDRFTELIWQTLDVEMPQIFIWGIDTLSSARRPCCAILDEASLADHLTWAATTGGFLWCPMPTLDEPAAIVREIRYPAPATLTSWFDTQDPSFLAASVTSGTSQIVNQVEVTQHYISNDEGETSAATTQSTWRNQASIRNWGIRTATADVALDDLSQAQVVAENIMSRATSTDATVSDVTVRGADWIAQDRPPQPLDTTAVTIRGQTHRLLVATVSHDLTPTTWTTTLTTIRRTP